MIIRELVSKCDDFEFRKVKNYKLHEKMTLLIYLTHNDSNYHLLKFKIVAFRDQPSDNQFNFRSEVRSHALRALTSVIYDRRSLKVLTIYDPRYRENASTTYDLRSLPFLTIRDLRSMTFEVTVDDLSPFV